ncbi:hypothetical protein, partial [Streptomyces sp. McG8]|uniref:hypothetical protein n=1 Tax=Streptomyces sp. McG8 TaxID=2725487 RepID=UPI001BE5CCFB
MAPGLAVLRAAAVLPGPVLVRTRTGTLRARTLRTGTLGARTLRTRTLRTGALRTGTLLLSGALRTGTLLLSGPPGQVEPLRRLLTALRLPGPLAGTLTLPMRRGPLPLRRGPLP